MRIDAFKSFYDNCKLIQILAEKKLINRNSHANWYHSFNFCLLWIFNNIEIMRISNNVTEAYKIAYAKAQSELHLHRQNVQCFLRFLWITNRAKVNWTLSLSLRLWWWFLHVYMTSKLKWLYVNFQFTSFFLCLWDDSSSAWSCWRFQLATKSISNSLKWQRN